MTEPNTSENEAPKPGTPEYDTAMAEKFRTAQGNVSADLIEQFEGKTTEGEQSKPERPAHVPEKFWDAETGQVRVDELVKSYTELESGKATTQDTEQATAADEDTTKEVVEAAGLNWDDLGTKVSTNGALDDADYEALEKIGVPRNIVDDYIAKTQVAQEAAQNAAYEYGGGEEAVNGLLSWAAQNLTPDEINGYNAMLSSPNWKVAIDTLKTRMGQSQPGSKEPNLRNPKTPSGGSTVGYKSEDEMKADMRNPLYFENSPKGETYRAEVREKVRLASYRR